MAVDLETRIRKTALRLYKRMSEDRPPLFRRDTWSGKAIELCLANPSFRTAFLRFLDVFPQLNKASLPRHVQEYLCTPELRSASETLGILCVDSDSTAAQDNASVLSVRLTQLAGVFVAGSTFAEAAPAYAALRGMGAAVSGDILGEAVVSEKEADAHLAKYFEFLDYLRLQAESWAPLGSGTLSLDWGHSPKINVSVKPSALYSQQRPAAFEHSVESSAERLRELYRKAVKIGAHVVLDMESRELKNITLALYKRVNLEPEFLDYPHTGLIVQSYLKESDRDLEDLLAWARSHSQRFTVRLVKGAYWEAERVLAAQRGWPLAIYQDKGQTDLAFERLALRLLENHPFLDLACASHNARTIAWVLENARQLKVPADRLEFQLLYGMADPLLKALLEEGLRVRVYAPVGELLPGMAYVIRRLLEATAPDSFLRQAYSVPVLGPSQSPTELLRAPRERPLPPQDQGSGVSAPAEPGIAAAGLGGLGPGGIPAGFRNEPPRDWTLAENRDRLAAALGRVRDKLPYRLAMVIGGEAQASASTTRREAESSRELISLNPNRPEEIIGFAPCARRKEVKRAVEAAARALPDWGQEEPGERAKVLFRAAESAREARDELAALEVLEAGKAWEEADADVCEAIDYLEYYGRLMQLLARGIELGLPGEPARLVYEPRGVVAVIAPWNFPLAISMGMVSAALVAGNPVLYKPSSLTPALGYMVYRLLAEAGLPPGALNLLPGAGGQVGDLLTEQALVAQVAFTGSKEVGLRILEKASRPEPHAQQVRSVIAEMGGKNAVLVDDDADLDEAVTQVVRSSFGYQGQKCSACSRVIVLQEIYPRFLERLKAACESLELGPVEDPKNLVGAVIDHAAQERIQRFIETGKREAKVLLLRKPPAGPGFMVPLAVFHDVPPLARIAAEEIFGPVLSVIRVKDFAQALEVANASQYALTGGVFSRSPAHLSRAEREFRVGNLYLNRGITGALVGRQPFGGFKMSGLGSKAGGPDYLLHFLLSRCITENSLRRGFAPDQPYRPAG
jgi:RHH-type proline utilization regulon transcriptional repressor/proline dehydrogenase/delta 1-pyrroline-5-carboxylate dehydrogenase